MVDNFSCNAHIVRTLQKCHLFSEGTKQKPSQQKYSHFKEILKC